VVSTDAYRHEALLYAGADEFLAGTVPFLRDGLEAGEPMLVAVPQPRLDLLRDALGPDGAEIAFVDMGELGANPARIIPAWADFLAAHDGRAVRGIGEPIWAGRSAEELVECRHHEALLNLAFADVRGFQLLCPYDVDALPGEVVDGAHRTHPHMVAVTGERAASERYACVEPLADPLPEPAGPVLELRFGERDLGAVRQVLAERGAAAGLPARRVEDLVLAGNEIASNSVRHGGGGGSLRVWQQNGRVLCEVRDRGFVDDPLAGRVRPNGAQGGGYGLWVANQVCELVQLRTSPGGTTVRLHVAR
jgi:anti-sigma regulatory factor (Ser/Thr protein kinase)